MENNQALTERLGFEPEYAYELHFDSSIVDIQDLGPAADELIRQNTCDVKGRYEEFCNTVQYKFDTYNGKLMLYIAPNEYIKEDVSESPYKAYRTALIFWIRIAGWFTSYKDY